MPRVMPRSYPSSVVFNGTTNSAVNITISSVLSSATAPYSFVSWVYVSRNVANTRFMTFSAHSYLTYDTTTRKFRAVLARTGGDSIVESPAFKIGQWYRFGITFDGNASNQPKLYIDGVDVGSSVLAGSGTLPAITTLTIGNRVTGLNPLTGNMVDSVLYNRVLTPTEMLSDYTDGITHSGLIGRWKFDEGTGTTANDSSGNGNHGTIVNGAWSTTTVPLASRQTASGRVMPHDMNGSLFFNGTLTRIDAGTDFIGTGDITVMGWFNPNSFGGATAGRIISNEKFVFSMNSITNNVRSFKATSNNFNTTVESASYSVVLNRWVHAAVIRKANGNITFYVNGSVSGVADNPGGTPTTAVTNTYIGDNPSGSRQYNGKMTDFVVIGRIATQAEITAHMNGITPATPIRSFKFNTGTGATAYDSSSNGANATIASPVWSRDVPIMSRQPINKNLVFNNGFEYAPPFTAATNVISRYIDGTAAGSTTNDSFGWALAALTGSGSAMFDTSKKSSGSYSMKLSTTAVASEVNVYGMISPATPTGVKLGTPVIPGISYTGSVYIESLAISGSAGSGAQMDFVERMADGTYVTSNIVSAGPTTQPMQKYTITFTPAAGTRYITPKLIVKGNNGANTLIMDAWFDDIVFAPTTPTSRVAL